MIILDKNYRIKFDPHCLILESRSDGKTSKGEHRDVWTQTFHPSYEMVAKKIAKEESKHANSLQEVVDKLEKTAKRIEKSIKKVG